MYVFIYKMYIQKQVFSLTVAQKYNISEPINLGAQKMRRSITKLSQMQINYLRIDADGLAALFAAVSEDAFVAIDTVGVIIPEHVALSGEGLVTFPTTEVTAVPVLVHRLGVFATENKLKEIVFINILSLLYKMLLFICFISNVILLVK